MSIGCTIRDQCSGTPDCPITFPNLCQWMAENGGNCNVCNLTGAHNDISLTDDINNSNYSSYLLLFMLSLILLLIFLNLICCSFYLIKKHCSSKKQMIKFESIKIVDDSDYD